MKIVFDKHCGHLFPVGFCPLQVGLLHAQMISEALFFLEAAFSSLSAGFMRRRFLLLLRPSVREQLTYRAAGLPLPPNPRR